MRNKFKACYKCEEKFLGCHATCEKYLAEVEQHRQEQEKIRAAKEKENAYVAYSRQKSRRFQ